MYFNNWCKFATVISKQQKMAKSNQEVKKEVFLDFKGCIEILKNQGQKVSFRGTAESLGYSSQGLYHVSANPPKALLMVLNYLKDNNLKVEDLVKEKPAK